MENFTTTLNVQRWETTSLDSINFVTRLSYIPILILVYVSFYVILRFILRTEYFFIETTAELVAQIICEVCLRLY